MVAGAIRRYEYCAAPCHRATAESSRQCWQEPPQRGKQQRLRHGHGDGQKAEPTTCVSVSVSVDPPTSYCKPASMEEGATQQPIQTAARVFHFPGMHANMATRDGGAHSSGESSPLFVIDFFTWPWPLAAAIYGCVRI